MHSTRYSEPWFLTSGNLDSLQSLTADSSKNQNPRGEAPHHPLTSYSPSTLHGQHTAAGYNHLSVFPMHPVQDDWYTLPEDIFSGLLQYPRLSYAEKGVQTIRLNCINEVAVQEQAQATQPPISLHLVSQVAFKSSRNQAEFTGPDTIVFVVDGQEGVRLSDASKGNWVGLKGRDDRSLFDGNRLQVLIRLHPVGCPPWKNKVQTVDFTAKRRPISRARLAAEVAKSVKKFIAREKLNSHTRCNWGDVSLENVFLTRMVRVSVASWQPEIFVGRPSASPQAAIPSSSSSSVLA